MPILVLRTLLIYFTVMAVMRLMGKRQLGELQPSELVSTILISNLASVSIESPELPLMGSFSALLLIAALELLLSGLAFKSRRAAQWMSGKPVVILLHGQPDQEAMRRLRFTASDLLEALRSQGIFDPTKVSYAAVETNGSLSAFVPSEKSFPEAIDPQTRLPLLPLLLDGERLSENMALCQKDEVWLERLLAHAHLDQQEVLMLLANDGSDVRLIAKKRTAPNNRKESC